jgi:plasmid stability protein
MITITLKDIPSEVHTALKLRAKRHGRSLNKEALACLESAVAPARVDVESMLAGIRQHRENLPGHLTDDLLRDARIEGRP